MDDEASAPTCRAALKHGFVAYPTVDNDTPCELCEQHAITALRAARRAAFEEAIAFVDEWLQARVERPFVLGPLYLAGVRAALDSVKTELRRRAEEG